MKIPVKALRDSSVSTGGKVEKSQYEESRMRRIVRQAVLKYAPRTGRELLRIWRHQVLMRMPPKPTPFGFQFSPPHLADGGYESGEIELFLETLENVSVCIDIGANAGLYSCLAASRGKQVVAVEPLATNLARLYRNLFLNKFLDVEVYPLGLSSKPGLLPIYGVHLTASFVRGWAKAKEARYSIVPVTTLDILAASRFEGLPMLIKIDVEGFELEVLRGAERLLSMTPKPIWLVEIVLTEQIPGGMNRKFKETFQLFWDHGYETKVADRDRRPVRKEDVDRWVDAGSRDFGSYNYLFVKA